MTTRFLHGPAVDQVFASEDALGEVLWALPDNQGTVRDVAEYDESTDTTSVVNHRKFDSFGIITSESDPTVEFMYSYTGRIWDPDAELYYYRNRWYDAPVGRFISEDPIGFAAGDTNLSRYVFNSPTNFTDPSGQSVGDWWDEFHEAWNFNHAMAEAKRTARDAWEVNLAFWSGVTESFADGRAADSAYGSALSMADFLTMRAFNLSQVPPLYGHDDAFEGGQDVGTVGGTAIASVLLVYGSYGAAQALAGMQTIIATGGAATYMVTAEGVIVTSSGVVMADLAAVAAFNTGLAATGTIALSQGRPGGNAFKHDPVDNEIDYYEQELRGVEDFLDDASFTQQERGSIAQWMRELEEYLRFIRDLFGR